jgi:adenosylhomocysteine nucleosidase
MPSDRAARARGTPRIAIVAALEVECASLRRAVAHGAPWLIVRSGPGEARAAAAAEQALRAGAAGLVSWGLAGGLDEAAEPGTVIVPRRILTIAGAPVGAAAAWHARLAALGDELRVSTGDLLTVGEALQLPAAKRAARAGTGAVAVDMESAGIAAVAARAGVPFAALRVIVDGVADALPSGAEHWVDERGRRRLAPVLRAVVTPREWRALATLARRFAVASRVLERLVAALVRRQPLALAERRAGS